MAFNLRVQSSVFDNPDLLREIGFYVEPRLPMYFVFHFAKEAFFPLEQKNEDNSMVIISPRWKFFSSPSMASWVYDIGCDFPMDRFSMLDNPFLIYAARGGYLETIEWILEFPSPSIEKSYTPVLYIAAQYGQIEILKYFRSKFPGIPWTIDWNFDHISNCCCCHAAYGGHLGILKWLRALDPPCPFCDDCLFYAAREGNLDCLQWILTAEGANFEMTMDLCDAAAGGGHIHILKWLRAQEPPWPWDEETCGKAAENDKLHVLQWLRAQDPPCPWDKESCRKASYYGHLNILQWLRAQDPPCPWDEETFEDAVESGHFHIIQWLRAQDAPCSLDTHAFCLSVGYFAFQ